jgi:hypothetical protein
MSPSPTASARRGSRRAVAFVGAIVALLALTLGASAWSAQPTRTLTVTVAEGGTVRSDTGAPACSARCVTSHKAGRVILLTPKAKAPFAFARWTGACVGTVPQCLVALDDPVTVGAEFTRLPGEVRTIVGGSGTVVSDPPGLSCGSSADASLGGCDATFGQGSTVRLVPAPGPGSTFGGWGGPCAGAPAAGCRVTVAEETPVAVAFRSPAGAPGEEVLTVHASGTGVTSTPPGILCPGACSATFAPGTAVTLVPAGIAAWGGACFGFSALGGGQPCQVVVDGPTSVVAQGVQQSPPLPSPGLSVAADGPGGVVSGKNIRCGGLTGTKSDCEHAFRQNTLVTLKAVASKKGAFVSWRGFCIGTKGRICKLRMTSSKNALAFFRKRKR